MTIKDIYEQAKAQGKENYEVRMTSADDKDIYIEPVYDIEFDDDLEWLLLV